MSNTLKEFLQEQAEKEQSRSQTAQAEIDEWRSAVDRLYRQIRKWLADSDPKGIIKIEEREYEASEDGLGVYRVPRLDLRAFGKTASIIPKVIHTIGTALRNFKTERALGRIDITDEISRHLLYRFREKDGSDFWMIIDSKSRGTGYDKQLTQENFEAALMSYFR